MNDVKVNRHRANWQIGWVIILGFCLFSGGCNDAGVNSASPVHVADDSSEVGTARKSDSRPNLLFIIADDLGYADLEAYGGEIKTPHLDALAGQGVSFNRFYTSLSCSPTRAMLLSGVDNHLAGLGNMAESTAPNQVGKPGYEGYLNDRVASLAEILASEGYHTYMAGKWHLGLEYNQSASARGFEREFSSLFGASSHFNDKVGPDAHRPEALYRKNGELVKGDLPDDFYSTKDYTQFLIDSIEEQRSDGRPFFGYLAYTAPHWPLQAPPENIEKYRGQYDQGWDAVRRARFERAKKLGIIPQQAQLPERPADIPAWASLSDADKTRYARYMEIYAGMIDYMDQEVGRLVRYLKDNNLFDNTLIVFMSDNGADALRLPAIIEFAEQFDNRLENAGAKGSFVLYGPPWALAGSAYLSRYKGSAHEGGVRVPAFITYPRIIPKRSRTGEMATVLDIMPTVLELTGTTHPAAANPDLYLPQGRSLMPLLRGEPGAQAGDSEEPVFGIEMWSQKAIIKGDWKILERVEQNGERTWGLFNVANDPGETNDLAAAEPKKHAEMQALWAAYVRDNNLQIYNGPLTLIPAGPLPAR